jgi:hypothetical protein
MFHGAQAEPITTLQTTLKAIKTVPLSVLPAKMEPFMTLREPCAFRIAILLPTLATLSCSALTARVANMFPTSNASIAR